MIVPDSRPVCDRVADRLRELLRKGAFQPGDPLMAPNELAWRMVLSPVAVRQAYRVLRDQGEIDYSEETGYTVALREVRP